MTLTFYSLICFLNSWKLSAIFFGGGMSNGWKRVEPNTLTKEALESTLVILFSTSFSI
jgi:hypothetical protein